MGNSSIEARKLSIVEYLAEIKDESIIRQIENILKPKNDFWDELTEEQKKTVRIGIAELDNGDRIDFKNFVSKYREDS